MEEYCHEQFQKHLSVPKKKKCGLPWAFFQVASAFIDSELFYNSVS